MRKPTAQASSILKQAAVSELERRYKTDQRLIEVAQARSKVGVKEGRGCSRDN